MRRHRETITSPKPYAIEDHKISERHIKTARGEKFYQYGPGNDCGLGFDSAKDMDIFYDHAGLTKLWNKPTWAIDGNFSVVPKPFYQLFTISYIENDSIFTDVFSLLINKNETTYKKLLRVPIELDGQPNRHQSKQILNGPASLL